MECAGGPYSAGFGGRVRAGGIDSGICFGLCDRRPDAAVVGVTQGRDDWSVRVLVPDSRVLDRGFHDATIIDMGDVTEPAVLEDDLSLLRRQWPVSAIQSMTWMQSDLDDLRSAAKKRYKHSRPGPCTYCKKHITCDMYRHVLTFHLALPGVVVHCVEGYATGLYGSCPGSTRYPSGY